MTTNSASGHDESLHPRAGDGRFTTKEQGEAVTGPGGVDLLGGEPDPSALPTAADFMAVLADQVPGTFDSDAASSFDGGGASIPYVDENGAAHIVRYAPAFLTVVSDDTDVSTESFPFAGFDRATLLAKAPAAIKTNTRQVADIKAFASGARTAGLAAQQAFPLHATPPSIDDCTGSVAYVDLDGASLALTGYTSADQDFGGRETCLVRLTERDGAAIEYTMVRRSAAHGEGDADGEPQYDYYRGNTRLLPWEASGLEAEADRRAGVTGTHTALTRVIMSAAHDHRHP